jgi:hypothetical protein
MKAKDLIFISRILSDGSGVVPVNDSTKKVLADRRYFNENYKLTVLSHTDQTYVASGFETYIVKKKQDNE